MELKNIKHGVKSLIENDIGKLTTSSYIKYADRRFRYGLTHVDFWEPKNLEESIAFRKTKIYESKPSVETLDQLLGSLWDLDRLPMLVILSKDEPEKQLHSVLSYYRDILNIEQQSVLFRLEDKNAGFNQLVRDRKVNNWVDNTTKIVYISKDKLPKLLVNCEWKPSVALCFDSMLDTTVNVFVNNLCDLIIFREEYLSPFRRHSSIYG